MEPKSGCSEAIKLNASTSSLDFDEMVRIYKKSLTEYIFRRIRDYHIAEDLSQEALLRAYQAMHTLDSLVRIKSWLFSIAYHVTVDWLRYQAAGKRSGTLLSNPDYAEKIAPSTDKILIMCEENHLLQRRVDHLWTKVHELPPIYRKVFELRYRSWRPIAQISKKIGIPEGSVKVRLFRARRMLLKALNKGDLIDFQG